MTFAASSLTLCNTCLKDGIIAVGIGTSGAATPNNLEDGGGGGGCDPAAAFGSPHEGGGLSSRQTSFRVGG